MSAPLPPPPPPPPPPGTTSAMDAAMNASANADISASNATAAVHAANESKTIAQRLSQWFEGTKQWFAAHKPSFLSRSKDEAAIASAAAEAKKPLFSSFTKFVTNHTPLLLVFALLTAGFLVFSMLGNVTTTFDSFNGQLIHHYTKGSFFFGGLSVLLFLFIIAVAVLQKTKPDYAGQLNYLKDFKYMLYIILFGSLIGFSHNMSMLIAYNNMNMDTENIPQWVFPLMVGMSIGFGLLVYILHAISSLMLGSGSDGPSAPPNTPISL